jgi:hypothetical protein
MSHHSLDGFTPISSDHIDGAKYNSMDQKLTVRFKNGYVYEVHAVSPRDHQEFMNAPSQGKHFHTCFKGNYHIERVK